MASYNELYAALKKFAPQLQIDGTGLQGELQRRAAEGATIEQVLADAPGYGELKDSANNYYKPEIDAAQTAAAGEQDVANNNAQRLRDSIAKIYKAKSENDPLRRQGIVSGAADQFNTEQQVEDTKSVETDLGAKLSDIARRLGDTRNAVATKSTTLLDTLRTNLTNAPQVLKNEAISTEGNRGDVYAKLQAAYFPDPVPFAVRESLGINKLLGINQ